MVRIRLRRVGAKKQPSYRIVAADKESPRDGKFLEILGHYNPRTSPATIEIKEDRVYDWIRRGAQPSDSVAQLFRTIGATERIKRMKAGEDEAALLEEAAAASEARVVDPRTRRDEELGKKAKPAPKAEVKEEAPAAEEAEEAPAEEEAPAAEEAEEAPAEEEAPAAEEAEEAPAEEEAPAAEEAEEEAAEDKK
jgi:small subunit ribosomal protein S16